MANKKLNVNLFSEEDVKSTSAKPEDVQGRSNSLEEINDETYKASEDVPTNTNETPEENDDLEKYRPENVNRKPTNDELKKRKKRSRLVVGISATLLIVGGITLWYSAANWQPGVYQINKVENNTLYLGEGGKQKVDFNKEVSVTAQWFSTTRQIIYTLDRGFFSGYTIAAWISTSNVNQDIATFTLSAPSGSGSTPTHFAINLQTKQYGTLDDANKFEADTNQANFSKLASKICNATTFASQPSSGPSPLFLLINLLPTILVVIMIIYFWRSMKNQSGAGGDSIFGIGKTQAKLAQSNVKFSDVAGIQEEKNELDEIVDYLKRPNKYAAMGARAPKGVILYGPPGTGKTLLAKAVAGEAGVPFFEASGSSFEDMLVGVGAKRVRDLFKKAADKAPSIIFIDEIDSVASKRGKNDIAGASGGIADQTINQLLAEMDGFSTNSGVIVIAATNRLDVLDPAILRPGRFDRHIQINLPDIKERVQILKIHSRNKNISSAVNLEDIARRTPGFSGAQLENVLNEATLLAVRENKNVIGMHELDEAIDRVIAGPAKQTRTITAEERKQIAYHEAGHALVGLHTPGSDVVQKITIIPRGNAAGYTLSTPEKQEMQIQRKSDLLGMIASTLGGRAAEELIFGKDKVSTGASNDLYKVTNIVRAMVMQLGMSQLGMTQFVPSEGTVNPYAQKLYSEKTAEEIDKEIDKIINQQYSYAIQVIKKNTKELELIVESLLTLETITKDQIDYIHKNLKLPKEVLDRKKKA